MIIMPALLTAASLTSTIYNGDSVLIVRPFAAEKDQEKLDVLCKDVWGGQDYLPSVGKRQFVCTQHIVLDFNF